MIISCPACTTRYVVPDNAIGMEGRTVRCAKCHHSWFQDGPELELAATVPAAAAQTATGQAAAAQPSATQAPAPPPPPQPVVQAAAKPATTQEQPARPAGLHAELAEAVPAAQPHGPAVAPHVPSATPFAQPDVAQAPPAPDPPQFDPRIPPAGEPDAQQPVADEAVSRFEHEPPFRARRNRLKLWTGAAALFALATTGIIAAVGHWGLPDWVPVNRPVFAEAKPELRLSFPPEKQDRRTLPNGTEFFGASGMVTNIGSTTQTVPPILIVLRDGQERIVYSWEVPPPKTKLAPGESVTVNEAVTDVPRSAKFAEIGWKPN